VRPVARHRTRRGVGRGFGLLEALVALVILATTGTAVFAWVNVNLDTVRRVRAREATDLLRSQLANWAQTLNPAVQAQGEAELVPGTAVRWTARPLLSPQVVPPLPGGTTTPFRVGLYELTLTAIPAGGATPVELTMHRLGLQRDVDPAPQGARDASR
jgi:general secretion pathway protein I